MLDRIANVVPYVAFLVALFFVELQLLEWRMRCWALSSNRSLEQWLNLRGFRSSTI